MPWVKECGDKEKTMPTDRFSRLPISIIHDILSYLPTEDIVRTSVLSKTWKGVWSSFPICIFDGYLFRDKSIPIPKHCGPGEVDVRWELLRLLVLRSIEVNNDEFIPFVSNALSRICNDGLTLDKFKLVMFQYNNCEHASHVDRWIEQLKRHRLQMLDLCFVVHDLCFFSTRDQDKESYGLPVDSFSYMSNSLVTLRLTGCRIEVSSLGNLVSLQELSLSDVHIDGGDVVKMLDATCPSIKNLSVIRCFGVRVLDLSNLLQLEKVVVYQRRRGSLSVMIIESITVKAPNLQTFHYYGGNWGLCKIDATSCKSLKELILTAATETEEVGFQQIISSFPLLSTLVLQELCSVGHSLRINISGRQLQTLSIAILDYLDELQIDAPNVRKFRFEGSNTELSCIKVNISNLCKCDLKLSTGPIDTALTCFHRIRGFLQNIGPNTSLTVDMPYISREDNTVFKELSAEDTSMFPPISLNNLNIIIGRQRKDWSYDELHPKFCKVIDGLLWSCYPKKLSVVPFLFENEVDDYRAYYTFLQCLCETLIKRGDSGDCCITGHHQEVKCWRHCLADYSITAPVDGNNPFDCDALLALLPTTMEEAWDINDEQQQPPRVDKEYHFQFQWKSSLL